MTRRAGARRSTRPGWNTRSPARRPQRGSARRGMPFRARRGRRSDRPIAMARPRPGKKAEQNAGGQLPLATPRQPPSSSTTRVLPMQLKVGDRLADETGEWEVTVRSYTSPGGKNVRARVRRVDQPATASCSIYLRRLRRPTRRACGCGGRDGSAREQATHGLLWAATYRNGRATEQANRNMPKGSGRAPPFTDRRRIPSRPLATTRDIADESGLLVRALLQDRKGGR